MPSSPPEPADLKLKDAPRTGGVPARGRSRRRVVILLAKAFVIDSRVMNEASSLRKFGHPVQVISWDRDGRQPSSFRHGGVDVKSVALVSGRSKSAVGYLLAGVLLQLYSFFWCLFRVREDFTLHANDFNTLLGGVMVKLAKRGRVRLVYDCHELTPSSFAEWFGSTAIGTLAGELEKRLARRCDAIVTVSPGIRSYLARETGKEVVVVANTPRLSQVPAESKSWWKEKLNLTGFVVSFVGYLRYDAALAELVSVARRFKAQNESGISFVVVGSGPDWEMIEREAKGLEGSFRLLPNVPYPLALGYVRASDLSFAVYRYRTTVGSSGPGSWLFGGQENLTMHWKVSEAMACQTCVVLRSGTSEWDFAQGAGFGISAGEGSEEEIYNAIDWAYRNPERAGALAELGHQYFVSDYNWDRMEERLLYAHEGALT